MAKDFKQFTGVSLKKTDIQNWTDAHFVSWFKLIHHFTIDKDIKFTELSLNSFRQNAKGNDFWTEWMHRFEAHLKDYDLGRISGRVLNSNRVIGTYLQNNPQAITTQMRAMMEGSKYLAKYAEPFVSKTTSIGAEIVSPNTEDLSKFTLPEVQYHEALLKMGNVARELLDGISKAEIKKMSPKDRLTLANTLLGTLSRIQGGQKPNQQVFKQIVINQAGRQELEAAMIEMTKSE